jgi:SRSO17 transposase
VATGGSLDGDDKAWLIIDDTVLPKKWKASIGVAPQYATVLDRRELPDFGVGDTGLGKVPLMLGPRLFLPESWTNDTPQMARACVPKRSKAVTQRNILPIARNGRR